MREDILLPEYFVISIHNLNDYLKFWVLVFYQNWHGYFITGSHNKYQFLFYLV